MDLLRDQTSDLRQDKMRLMSQIAELQNQNAQLIEDHTRDVLQIKAKETQLVRARSDAENAEERGNSLSKEIDRLKREMSRLGRQHNGAGSPPLDYPQNQQASMSSGLMNGDSSRPAYTSNRSHNLPSGRTYSGDSGYHQKGNGMGDEGKENIPSVEDNTPGAGFVGRTTKLSSGFPSGRPISNGHTTSSSGRVTPASSLTADDQAQQQQPGTLNRSQSEGVESWRRAAEVTQNLKARIELMKVCFAVNLCFIYAGGRVFFAAS